MTAATAGGRRRAGRHRRPLAVRLAGRLTACGIALIVAALTAVLAGCPRASVLTLAALGLAALILPAMTAGREYRRPEL